MPRVPTDYFERTYLLTDPDADPLHVEGPINPVVEVGDTILVWSPDRQEQWAVVISTKYDDLSADVTRV